MNERLLVVVVANSVSLLTLSLLALSRPVDAAQAARQTSAAASAQPSAPVAAPVTLPGPGLSIPVPGTTTPIPASTPPASAAPSAATSADWPAIARWPDFMGGVWTNDQVSGGADAHAPAQPKFKEGVAAATSTNASNCEPRGIPLDIGGAFFFTKDAVLLMTDLDYFVVRRIDMVRRDHGEPELTYYGDSLGHWDGKTLVVDTTGFLPQVQIAEGYPGNSKTQLLEKFKMTAPDRIELEITVINPDLLQEPWVTLRTLTRHPEWSLHETYCISHQQD